MLNKTKNWQDEMFYDKELVLMNSHGDKIECNVQMRDFYGKSDCKVGSFSHNFWFRTYGAMVSTFKGYKTRKTMELAIEKKAKKIGLTIVGWTDKSKKSFIVDTF